MENNILEIIKKFNGSLITGVEDENSIVYNEEFIILKNNSYNYFCIFEMPYDIGELNSDKIVSEIEDKCLKNAILKNIKPQFIYSIIILKTNEINDYLYKKVIEIEEDEYFCKKYVFYYKEEEIKKFLKWTKVNKLNTFNELINQDDNYKLFDKKNDELEALKFMLRLIIKFVFIKVIFKNENTYDFNYELERQIKSIKNQIDRNKIEDIKNIIFSELLDKDLDDAVTFYLDGFREN